MKKEKLEKELEVLQVWYVIAVIKNWVNGWKIESKNPPKEWKKEEKRLFRKIMKDLSIYSMSKIWMKGGPEIKTR